MFLIGKLKFHGWDIAPGSSSNPMPASLEVCFTEHRGICQLYRLCPPYLFSGRFAAHGVDSAGRFQCEKSSQFNCNPTFSNRVSNNLLKIMTRKGDYKNNSCNNVTDLSPYQLASFPAFQSHRIASESIATVVVLGKIRPIIYQFIHCGGFLQS